MKLLMSAYACAPNRGSEHGIGWSWVTEASRQGNEVWALVAPNHRDAIERACRERPALRDIHWNFPEVRFWSLRQGIEPVWERTYNLLWQRAALKHARALHRSVKFDVVHHITWGGIRAPSFLGRLNVPLILGPLGGGETSPQSLRDAFGFKAKVLEGLRDMSTATIAINPILRSGFNRAAMIAGRTDETRFALPKAMQRKAITFADLTLDDGEIGEPRQPRESAPRLLFAGRLLYWKGVHLAIDAFARFAKARPDARLTIVGKGPEEARLRKDAAALGVEDKIDFLSWIPQERLFDLYADHDLFVFPSLHDSGGAVVLEALARGLPVMCLDLGGPACLVTPDCGVVISTAGRNSDDVAAAMAQKMTVLFGTSQLRAALSAGAITRAREFIISKRIASFYENAFVFIAQNQARTMRNQYSTLVAAKR